MVVSRLLVGLLRAVGLLFKLGGVAVATVVGWLFVGRLVRSGQLPPAPLGLAAMGLPPTLFGIPTAYAGGIVLFAGLLLFGDGSGSGTDGIGHGAHDGGGGFGDGGGDGGGGGGGGDGE